MIFAVIGAVIICLLISRKHENDLDKAIEAEEPNKVMGSGTKTLVWTLFTLFFGIIMMLMLGIQVVGVPK